jgi:hypothetical protein
MKSYDKGEWIVNKGCKGGMDGAKRKAGRDGVSGVEIRSIKRYEGGNGM